MTKQRSTKRALLLSALSLLMCVSMLIGSTFAWFTDSVTSKGNIIKSGTLDVTMEWADGKTDPANTSWTDAAEGAIFNYDLWEPGYTEVRHIKIANAGTLALKYQLNIVANGDVSKLADVIDVYYLDPAAAVADRADLTADQYIGTLTEVLAAISTTASGNLLAGENHTVTLALKMRESAGNEYQGLSIGSDFSVQLMATQLTHENDSFDNQYDVGAPYDLPAGVSVESFGDNVAYCNGTYYASVLKALEAIHNTTDEANVLYLKPGADLGTITHAHVCNNLTVYGNGAYISGGEADFEVGYYTNNCAGLNEDFTLTVYDLKGVAVWGNRTTDVTVNINLYNCEDINRVYMNGVAGVTNINIVDSTFDGTNGYYDTAVYSNNPGEINLTNVTVKAYSVGMNINNKSEGTQNITLTNCTFIDCATIDTCGSAAAYAAPVRVVATEYATAVSNVALNNCEFVYTTANKAVDGDILTLDKREGKLNNGTVNVTVNGNPVDGILVGTAEALQSAVDTAVNGDKIVFVNGIEGDVTVTQKADTKITIDGNGNAFAGVITVDGKSATYTTAGLTIKNIKFVADSISADACIQLGDGTNATRYTCNVTVDGCTFDVPGAVGVKSYTGGDKNLVIQNCTATANAHSLVQAKGIDGVLVEECKVYSKNGLNFNNSDNVTVVDCEVDVKGYAVRFGESSGGSGAAETYKIQGCTLKSQNDEGDATIILRGTADNATLTITDTTIVGNPDIKNTATNATVVR